jgi:hypothetical protein
MPLGMNKTSGEKSGIISSMQDDGAFWWRMIWVPMDDTLKNRLRTAGFSNIVDGSPEEVIRALLVELESSRAKADMRSKETESVKMALKSVQSDLWVQREMFGQTQQQWVMALRKIHQMAVENEAQAPAGVQRQ